MKIKSLKVFFGIIALAIVGEFAASAQLTEIVKEYNSFETITVDKDFDVTVVPSTEYKAVVTVDQPYADFTQVYVKEKSLVISLDKVPKQVTKLYKGKNAPKPTFNVVVYTPAFGGVNLSDNAVLNATEVFESESVNIKVEGKAQIKNLSVQASSVKVNATKNAMVNLTADADEINVATANSANLKLNFSCDKIYLSTKNSSTVTAVGETYETSIASENSSKIIISGESTNKLSVKSSNSSNVDASALSTEECSVVMANSSTVSESAKGKLSIEMTGGTLLFGGDPVVDIVNIKSASVQRRQ